MARMWPRELPDEILSNPLRSSEVRVYMALASSLDDSYVVFYSRPWLGLTWDGREIDGECDFVVAHPNRGMLAIEVKGGGIEYNPEEERWFSVDRYGCRHNIKNPVAQARTSKHELLRKLREDTAWRGRYIRARHGVILPDCLPSSSDLGADMPRGIFASQIDLNVICPTGYRSVWAVPPPRKRSRSGIMASGYLRGCLPNLSGCEPHSLPLSVKMPEYRIT